MSAWPERLADQVDEFGFFAVTSERLQCNISVVFVCCRREGYRLWDDLGNPFFLLKRLEGEETGMSNKPRH